MHSALLFKRLNEIDSATYRRLAHSAAKGSLQSLGHLKRSLARTTRTFSDTDVVHMLPVFYANLDPSAIPAVADLDTSSTLPSLECAALALNMLQVVTCLRGYPEDVSLELWPRVWQWIDFFHEYREFFNEHRNDVFRAGPIDARVYITWGLLLMAFREHPPTEHLMSKQPGVDAFCTRAWMLTLDVAEDERAEVFAKAQFMRLLNPANPRTLREMRIEAGGTYDDLAVIMVRHITRAIPRQASGASFFAAIGTVLNEADDRSGLLNAALLANGVVEALLKAIPLLDKVTHPVIPSMRSSFLTLIARKLITPPGYTWISRALDAGLLNVLVTLPLQGPGNVDTQVVELIQLILPAMVYYPIVSRMAQCIQAADRLIKSSFQKSRVYPAWLNLKNLYEERLQVLKAFKSRQRPSQKACDNPECDTGIDAKANFKRCGGCESVYYCSTECQVSDWKVGGHRTTCQHLRSIRFQDPLSSRDRSFLRTVMHRDYELSKGTKTQASYYLLFDYTQGRIELKLKLIPPAGGQRDAQGRDWAALWTDYSMRVERSRGTMALHLMAVKEGTARRLRLFPLRSASKRIRENAPEESGPGELVVRIH
ncbi:hypothetical protein B0H16DRAFT_1891440 [Mycena metata]|uniref:phytol kinase n=1 Tax=Mycena metata TaxID=1033252 RepID=A0AAD7MYW1_9AGAR|nr:hypothetical protein B0H16DRAFT_1891440 [Mycena metata]